MHNVESWSTDLFVTMGRGADAACEKAFPLIVADPTRVPDHFVIGPDLPCDELVRKRFFGKVQRNAALCQIAR